MKVDIVVNAQRYENYGEDRPYWKPKGGQTVIFPVDDSFIMNPTDKVVEAIDYVLGQYSDHRYKYTYIDHVVEFSKPITCVHLEETFDLIFGGAK